jgi:tetratricopeptide (TPR) repeat protein
MPGSEPDSSGGSSSSSSSSSSADDPNSPGNTPSADKPPTGDKSAPPKTGRRRLPKIEKLQSDEERAEEDLKVSKFYEDAGKLNAAYLRAQDAVKYQPSDPETHFALAQVAQKMEKKDEAVSEYNAYLQLAPDGLRIKQAQKALSQLQH